MHASFEDVRQRVQADREFVDTKLSRIDESSIIKRWVESLMHESNVNTNDRIDKERESLQA